jgi:hypothetical protein
MVEAGVIAIDAGVTIETVGTLAQKVTSAARIPRWPAVRGRIAAMTSARG